MFFVRTRLFLLLVCYVTVSACGEPLSVRGMVLDNNLAPIAGAGILLKRTDSVVFANEAGEYHVTHVRIGDTLVYSKSGYISETESLSYTTFRYGRGRLTVVLKNASEVVK